MKFAIAFGLCLSAATSLFSQTAIDPFVGLYWENFDSTPLGASYAYFPTDSKIMNGNVTASSSSMYLFSGKAGRRHLG
jgi:hypothetical protein